MGNRVVHMRSTLSLGVTALFIGLAIGSLFAIPEVDARCHCITSSCHHYEAVFLEDHEKDLNDDGWVDETEDPCPYVMAIKAFLEDVGPTLTFEGYVGALGATIGSEGEVFLHPGGALLGIFVTATTPFRNATITFETGEGYTLDAVATLSLDAHTPSIQMPVTMDADMPELVTIPFTVAGVGNSSHSGEFVFHRAPESTTNLGGLEPMELAIVSAVIGAMLGGILVGLAMVVFRR
jgi:hypothetical protein